MLFPIHYCDIHEFCFRTLLFELLFFILYVDVVLVGKIEVETENCALNIKISQITVNINKLKQTGMWSINDHSYSSWTSFVKTIHEIQHILFL